MQFVRMDRMLSNEVGSSHLLQENIDLICVISITCCFKRGHDKKIASCLDRNGLEARHSLEKTSRNLSFKEYVSMGFVRLCLASSCSSVTLGSGWTCWFLPFVSPASLLAALVQQEPGRAVGADAGPGRRVTGSTGLQGARCNWSGRGPNWPYNPGSWGSRVRRR